jgi:hypothetical protein
MVDLDSVSTADLERELEFRRTTPKAYLVKGLTFYNALIFRVKKDLMIHNPKGQKFYYNDTIITLVPYKENLVEMLIDLGCPSDLVNLAWQKNSTYEDTRPWQELLRKAGL